jgi:hypothetical protein
MNSRNLVVPAAILALLLACDSTTEPTQSELSFTFTPNPVPTAGFMVGCAGGTVPEKTWLYTLTIRNNNGVPFVVESASFRLMPEGGTTAIEARIDAATFAAAFGTATIQGNDQIQAPLCTRLNANSGTTTYTLVGAGGNGTFTTPTLQLLP